LPLPLLLDLVALLPFGHVRSAVSLLAQVADALEGREQASGGSSCLKHFPFLGGGVSQSRRSQ
jgi:hypothetical protein